MIKYNFEFTIEDANTILQALGELPFKKSNELIINIQKQYQEQTKTVVEKVE